MEKANEEWTTVKVSKQTLAKLHEIQELLGLPTLEAVLKILLNKR